MGDRNSKPKGTKETLLLVGPQYPGWTRDTQEHPIVTTQAPGPVLSGSCNVESPARDTAGDPRSRPPSSPTRPSPGLFSTLPPCPPGGPPAHLLCPAEKPPTLQDLSTPQCPRLPTPSHSTVLHRLVHHLAGPEPHTPPHQEPRADKAPSTQKTSGQKKEEVGYSGLNCDPPPKKKTRKKTKEVNIITRGTSESDII